MEVRALTVPTEQPDARLREQVLAEYRRGRIPVREIARKHKIGTNRVIKWAKDAGLARPRGRPRLPDQQIQAALAELRDSPLSLQQIAQRHGISTRTLRTRAREAGIPTSRREGEQERYERLKPLVLADYQNTRLSLYLIAKKHGISASTVGNWAAAAGLQRGSRPRVGTQTRREPVLRDYTQSDLTVREIARRHQISETSVRNWAKQAGVKREQPAVPPRSRAREAVIADYVAGELTVKQIAERHGVSQSSVNKWAREAGHTRRAREEQRLAALKPHILHAYTTTTHSIGQLAERFNVHKSTVHRYVKQAGLGEKHRPRSHRP